MDEVFCFGRFALDPVSRQLYADGTPVVIGQTAVTVLLTLVEQAGRIVTKDELMSQVWGRAAVGDNRLHVHVYELRKVLGDDFIATKSGRGYRFVGAVRRSTQAEIIPKRQQPVPLASDAKIDFAPQHLVGRATDVVQILRRLKSERLVTLAGPGGVGKTSLALETSAAASEDFLDGVWFVDLGALSDPALVTTSLATALNLNIGQAGLTREAVARQLSKKSLLIVLDNCEHVIDEAMLLAEAILKGTRAIKMIATSRVPLSCRDENVYQVLPLRVPEENTDNTEEARHAPAVMLFIQRACAASSGLSIEPEDIPTIARICRRLDGVPLALEMAAGWVGVLGLDALEARLDDALNTGLRARGTAPVRHSTLRATLKWSHDLLTEKEQILFRRLSVFSRDFSIEDAIALARDDRLSEPDVIEQTIGLYRKSMLSAAGAPARRRYRYLEITRTFALECLAKSGEAENIRRRHAQHILARLERATIEWETMSDRAWIDRYKEAINDVRIALDWAILHEPDNAVLIAGASWPLWRELSLHAEARQRFASAATLISADTPLFCEAALRRGIGELWSNTSDIKLARDAFARAADIYRQLADPLRLGSVLSRLAFTQLVLEDRTCAKAAIEESLTLLQQYGTPRALASAYATQVCVEARTGHYENAKTIGEVTISLAGDIGAERLELVTLGNLTEFALEQGDVGYAIEFGKVLVRRLRDSGHSDLLAFASGLLVAALVQGDAIEEACTLAREAAPLLRDEAMLIGLLDHLALLTALKGNLDAAARTIGFADAALLKSSRPREPIAERSVNRLMEILRPEIEPDRLSRLRHEGSLMSEDQILAMSLQ